MRVLIVGGSGYLGGLLLPALASRYYIRVLDLLPPRDGPWEYVLGDVTNPATLIRAMAAMDTLVYMAKGSTDEDGSFNSIEAAISAFDVSVKGLYFTLEAASRAGISHAVYTSSMSIYRGSVTERYFPDENLIADAPDVYGFTKHLGEEVCRHAVRAWGMSVNALRLCLPLSTELWLASRNDKSLLHATASDDVARALSAALVYRSGFQSFTISGDKKQRHTNLSKAKRLLKWVPRAGAR